MRRCLHCDASFFDEMPLCPACGTLPARIDGFWAHAPAFAHGGGGFKADYYDDLARLEGKNFWFRARNALIIWALRKYCPGFRSMLEIGCGTAYVLSGVARDFPDARLVGSEIFVAGLGFAAGRVPSAEFVQMDARAIPFREEFDVVGAFDVIEHIEEDERVLAQMHEALVPGGRLVLTVPQHEWLWSASDEYACHVRRYRASELHRKVSRAGFELVRSTSFVTALMPALVASRLRTRKTAMADFDPHAEFDIPPILDALLEQVLSWERACIRAGVNLPVGGSRLLIAKKI